MAVDASGNVWVVDQVSDLVQEFGIVPEPSSLVLGAYGVASRPFDRLGRRRPVNVASLPQSWLTLEKPGIRMMPVQQTPNRR